MRDDSGRYVIAESGLEYELYSIDRFSVATQDPLTASGEVTFHMSLGRGAWQTRAVTRTVLRASATEFRIHAELDAWEDDTQLAERRWDVTVPRRLV